MAITLFDGATVEVKLDPTVQVTPTVTLPYPNIEVLPMLALQGPKGDPGEDAKMKGHIQHVGQGPPGVIVGAEPGDTYLDKLTGLIWTLE